MDKSQKAKKKIRIIGNVFRVILTIIMVIGIIVMASTALMGITILFIPADILPEDLNAGFTDFISGVNAASADDDEDVDYSPILSETESAPPVITNSEDAEAYFKKMIKELIGSIGNGRVASGIEIGLSTAGVRKELTIKELIVILSIAISLFSLMIVIYSSVLNSMMKTLSKGERPFTIKAAKKLRRLSILMLLLILFEPLTSLVLFSVTLIFSYLFEYGAYLQEKADETSRIQEEMIMSFAEVTENKSEQTGKHVRRVAEYSKIIAEEMGLDDERVSKIRLASTMHDIGKLMIPSEILEKPARLTDDEFAEIKKHPGYGGKLLNNVEGDVMELAKTIALDHHERVDGRGYPEGKSGNYISTEGRIVAVADVYDALTSKRSYKEPWDHQKAYEEILKGSGTQFDADVVEAFKKRYDDINSLRQKYADEAE